MERAILANARQNLEPKRLRCIVLDADVAYVAVADDDVAYVAVDAAVCSKKTLRTDTAPDHLA